MDGMVGRLDAKLAELGIRDNTLLVFLGDNGTNKGITSRFRGSEYRGGKGTTTHHGTHVPLIISWPNVVKQKKVQSDLVSSVDILPTICDAASVMPPEKIDGISFLPQIRGEKGTPRSWLYCWYSPRQQANLSVKELAFNHRYKLYRDGEFYDLQTDPLEKSPKKRSELDGDAARAAIELQKALDQYKNARLRSWIAPFKQLLIKRLSRNERLTSSSWKVHCWERSNASIEGPSLTLRVVINVPCEEVDFQFWKVHCWERSNASIEGPSLTLRVVIKVPCEEVDFQSLEGALLRTL